MTDYKTRIIPDHLYPKFRLSLDKFKNGTNIPHMELSAQQDNTSTPQDTDDMEKRTKTGYVEPIQVQEANNSELYETPTQV